MPGPAPFTSLRRTAAVAFLAIAAFARVGDAQGAPAEAGPAVTIRAARSDTVRVDAGAALTAVFALRNVSPTDSARVTVRLALPAAWRTVTGESQFVLAPGAGDTWLAGVSVPVAAASGTYLVRGSLDGGGSDSLVVQVAERRGLEVVALDAPGWVMAGDGYEARFMVRNTGNVPATVQLVPGAGRAASAVAEPASLKLAAAASAVVTVRTAITPAARHTADDVVQLVAIDVDNADARARASARTTVVPRNAGAGAYTTVPVMFAVRSTGASGVSPLVVGGSGRLADGRTNVDFFLQAPTDQRSQWGFGERDEYRVELSRDGNTLRLGDHVFGKSPLTTTGALGSGAEFSRTSGPVKAGVFAQQYRWIPGHATEQGVYADIRRDSLTGAAATALMRQSGGANVSAGALGGSTRLPLGGRVEVEGALSDSARVAGAAWRARIAGDTLGVRYEAAVYAGDDSFTGPARGTRAANVAIGASLPRDLDVSANVSRRSWSHPASTGRMGQAYSTATIAATWRGANAIEYGMLSRRDEGAALPVDGSQHGVRVSTVRQFGSVGASGSVEHGAMKETRDGPSSRYALVSLALRAGLGSIGSVGVSGSKSVGRTLAGANGDVLAAGANAQLRLPLGLEVGFTMTAQRATFGVLDTSGAWFSVADARVSRRFENGATVGLHARMLQSPGALGTGNTRAVYLEYRGPFRMPVGRSREAGRAIGQVMDADRRAPVAGVLVRLGDEAAVSDRNGFVRFAGLEGKAYRVTVDPTGVSAGAILVGDLDVDMSAATATPRQFAVAVTRGARVAAYVGKADADQLDQPAGGPAPSPSRMTIPVAGALVALVGPRDTIYQMSDTRGAVEFGTVAPGSWTVAVVQAQGDDYMELDRDRIDVTVAAGERKAVEFVMLPVARRVNLIDGGVSLQARPIARGIAPARTVESPATAPTRESAPPVTVVAGGAAPKGRLLVADAPHREVERHRLAAEVRRNGAGHGVALEHPGVPELDALTLHRNQGAGGDVLAVDRNVVHRNVALGTRNRAAVPGRVLLEDGVDVHRAVGRGDRASPRADWSGGRGGGLGLGRVGLGGSGGRGGRGQNQPGGQDGERAHAVPQGAKGSDALERLPSSYSPPSRPASGIAAPDRGTGSQRSTSQPALRVSSFGLSPPGAVANELTDARGFAGRSPRP